MESSSCTNLLQYIFVTRVTVATDWRQHQVVTPSSLQSRCTLKRVKLESNKPCVHVRKSVKLSSRNIYLFWRQHDKMCEYAITHNKLFSQTDFLPRTEGTSVRPAFHKGKVTISTAYRPVDAIIGNQAFLNGRCHTCSSLWVSEWVSENLIEVSKPYSLGIIHHTN